MSEDTQQPADEPQQPLGAGGIDGRGALIRVVIEMDPRGGILNIRAVGDPAPPPPIVFGIIVAAYHEMLSAKIRNDLEAQRISIPHQGLQERLRRMGGGIVS